jgi:magnesium-transporting ATPase (P-type)
VRTQIPFNPHRKRSIVALQHPDMDDIVRVYVKGAPEIIILKCTKTIGINGQVSHMNDEE